jgi:2'-5' RNA ligase
MQDLKYKRLFVAIGIVADDGLKDLVSYLKENLAGDRINWVNLENIHLTLKFLGETPSYRIEQIVAALEEVAAVNKSIEYSLSKCGIFGSRYDPRVIWLGADKHPEAILKLGKDVIDAMHHAGFDRDRQNYVPHLTLGRIKQISDKQHFQKVISETKPIEYQTLKINEFRLYESVLKAAGPIYSILARFPLKMDA